MVAPAPKVEVAVKEIMPQPSEDSDSDESYEAQPEGLTVSTGDAWASEAFLGRCNKVEHHFWDEECEMYDPDF